MLLGRTVRCSTPFSWRKCSAWAMWLAQESAGCPVGRSVSGFFNGVASGSPLTGATASRRFGGRRGGGGGVRAGGAPAPQVLPGGPRVEARAVFPVGQREQLPVRAPVESARLWQGVPAAAQRVPTQPVWLDVPASPPWAAPVAV